jgi:hypothetical protein
VGCTFGCLPDWAATGGPAGTVTLDNPDGGPNLVVNGGQFTLCNMYPVCDCGPTSCSIRLDQPNWTFDVQVTPEHIDGSIAFGTSDVHNIHLTGPSDGGR